MDPDQIGPQEQSDLGPYCLLSSKNSLCGHLNTCICSRRKNADKIVVGEGLIFLNDIYLR